MHFCHLRKKYQEVKRAMASYSQGTHFISHPHPHKNFYHGLLGMSGQRETPEVSWVSQLYQDRVSTWENAKDKNLSFLCHRESFVGSDARRRRLGYDDLEPLPRVGPCSFPKQKSSFVD